MHPSTPSSPPSGADLRALRARLLEKLSAVKAYFEATSINLNLRSPYWGAFDALRRNQPLAESFVNDLQGLLQFLDNDLAPILTALQSGGGTLDGGGAATGHLGLALGRASEQLDQRRPDEAFARSRDRAATRTARSPLIGARSGGTDHRHGRPARARAAAGTPLARSRDASGAPARV
ncbi:hypothetical protein [Haliangium sp. UPWRP_2]|uniref:hypothetical protein n=1 Tax=Haliangium sp. UPWRP_2 TaxID=1931276 RepID=UPI001E2C801B|nr:hypothetical protein [Haliangium sp. UPWRP_2]